MTTSTAVNTVAKTILQQLGGNKFLAMTGSKNLIASEMALTMDLIPNKTKSKKVKITLTPMDLYRVEFYSVCMKTFTRNVKKSFEGVYCDQLVEIFEKETGLITKL